MPILKRRLDICGRERAWEYVIESCGMRYDVSARQIGRGEPEFSCSCGVFVHAASEDPELPSFQAPCTHILEAQRDLSIARQAAAQMVP
jgi:hypothetical protein